MKNKFLFFTLMLLIGTQVAVDAQELTLSDVQNSGCLDSKHARANGHANINEYNRRPTIILTKEGTILTVQLYNYEANCGTTDFEVTPNISGGSNGAPYSVSIQVIPIGDEEDCICPYNISFTIHDLEATDFFFSCCWFQGLVTLTENKPLVLGDINEVVMAEVNIDGLNYTLENITNTARLIAAKRGYDIKGELNIPSEINYEEQKYRVTSLDEYAFLGCYDLTSVDIPYSVTSIGDAAFMGCSSLTDVYCHAEDVPNTSNSVFTSTPIVSATLHVPTGSVDKYKATAPWNGFGNIVAMPIEINETNFPDENFRNFLLSYYDYPKDGVLTEAEIAIIKIINVYEKGIKSLKGIEYLTAVSDLECVNNQLTELDVSKNTALGYLECSGNPLTSLNVSGCTALGDLICTGTPLTKLDVSGCPKLEYLSCPNNQITTLNVSKNTALTSLKCSGNQLTVLDVSGCTALGDLYCDGNQLTSLDLSKNTKLYALACYNNQLTTLDVSQNTKLQWVAFHQNQIKGAAMDAFLESLPTVDNRTMNVIHNVNEHNVMTKSQVTAAKAKHWEPLYYDGSSWQKYEGSEPIEPVTFTKDQMATIILPTAPDAGKGKYYRLDRVENGQIVFEQELQPQARIPYIIVPDEDFSIDPSSLDLESLQADTVTVGGVSFIGSYVRKELPALTGGDGGGSLYYDIIDTTPDCGFLSTAETGKEAFRIGALRAYLTVNWDDPYNHHGSKSPEDKLDIVLKDDGTGIEQIQSSKFKIQNDGEEVNGKWSNGKCYDLSGRKWSMINGQRSMPKGIYIQNNRKLVK